MVETGWNVAFTDKTGGSEVAVITRVWERQGGDDRPPLVNLTVMRSAEEYTSVPHRADVVGASGFYYS